MPVDDFGAKFAMFGSPSPAKAGLLDLMQRAHDGNQPHVEYFADLGQHEGRRRRFEENRWAGGGVIGSELLVFDASAQLQQIRVKIAGHAFSVGKRRYGDIATYQLAERQEFIGVRGAWIVALEIRAEADGAQAVQQPC